MTATVAPNPVLAEPTTPARFPILAVLHPREHTRLVVVTVGLAIGGAIVARTVFHWELWQAVVLVLLVLAVPAAITWRADARRYGVTAAVAGALVTMQGLHTVEHVTQWAQRHILHEPLRQANGLLSPANSEWVHFVWNWSVLVPIVFLMFKGMRGFWGLALLAWALGHTFEHTYMFWRYLEVRAELRALGFDDVTAQGLPGIVGDGGWLDLNAGPQLQLICGFPGITTADRLDTHFAWNMGEILLAIPAVHYLLRNKVDAFRR
jgi:hypothetical protein